MRGLRRHLLGIAVATVVACGSLTALAGPAAAKSDLPPATLTRLQKLFRSEVEPLDLRVTRGMLQNPTTYEPDPEGTHLALYVEPRSSDYTTADYVRNFTKLTHRFVPKVFNRWPGIETFDICQEPVGDERDKPPPVTQIYVSRSALDRVAKWRKATLSELLAAAPKDRRANSDYYVYFDSAVRSHPAFVAAAQDAGYPTDGV